MRFTNTKKTPVAQLAGESDEGLNPTPAKEQNMHQSTVPTRLDLEGLVIDVDPSAAPWEHVEITFSTRWSDQEPRSTYGVALTREEARKLAEAILDSVAPAFGSVDREEIEEHVRVARKAVLPMTPAKCCKAQKEFDKLDLPALAQGTVLDIFHAAQKVGISPSDLLRQLDLEEEK